MNCYLKLFWSLTLKGFFITLLMAIFLSACQKENLSNEEPSVNELNIHSANLVKVTSTGLNFNAPEEIPAGWNTFTYMNKTSGTHFFSIAKMPDGKGLEDYEVDVSEPFQSGMDYYREGNFLRAFSTQDQVDEMYESGELEEPITVDGFGTIAPWYGQVSMHGGPGLISPGETATTTAYLEPGTYIIECYVKTQDGVFHSYDGKMIKEITVTGDASYEDLNPTVDVSVEISTDNGIDMQEDWLQPGNTTFAVNFKDLKEGGYGNLLQHDVHLVRFENGFNDTDKEILDYWMNWIFVDFDGTAPIAEGLMNPAPEGITFLGGTQEIPAGQTSYFTATLTPGDYALISEIDDPLTLSSETGHPQFYHQFSVSRK